VSDLSLHGASLSGAEISVALHAVNYC
jgi:hypothetical protein